MEALDVGSGRLYFVRLETNAAGDSVRPLGETSWEQPEGFLVRQELVAALSATLHERGGAPTEDDATFLAKVRERFPPPSTPPPSGRDVAELLERVRQLEAEKAALAERAEAAEEEAAAARSQASAPPMGSSAPSCGVPPALGNVLQRPSWKRGASSKFTMPGGALTPDAGLPPPPPKWALEKAMSGGGPYDGAAEASAPGPSLNRRQSGAI